jgi:ribose transport system permease protein
VATAGPGGGGLRALASSSAFGLAAVTCLLVLAFTQLAPGFLSPFNLYALGRNTAIDLVIGLAMMTVIVTGGLDLAVGSMGVCAAMVLGWLMQSLGLPVWLSIPLAMLSAAALGWLNGLLTVRTGASSFVVTLATMSVYFGVMIVLSRADPFNGLPDSFTALGKQRVFGVVWIGVFVALAAALLLAILYRFTSLGRAMLAVGANRRAAELSGIPVGRVTIACHALCGGLAGLAAIMLTARNGAALPSMAGHIGVDWLLPAFLAPVLGGTPLTGGAVSVLGTVLGALLVSVISNGLFLLKVGEFWVQLFLGLILLAAVLVDRLRAVLAARRPAAA